MKFLNLLKRLVLYANLEPATYKRIESEVDKSNTRSVLMFSSIVFAAMVAMIVVSFAADDLAHYRVLYCIGAVSSAAIIGLDLKQSRNRHRLTLVLMYALESIVLFFGVLLGTVSSPNEIAAAYIAILLMAPQMFTDRPIRLLLLIWTSIVFFVVMVLSFKAPTTWNSDIVNVVTFGFISSVCCLYMMSIKAERFNLVETVRYMAETDQLTGLKNRNSFELKLQSVSVLQSSSIYCVYVDVNGLHELNNSQGHEAGDRMLQYIATVMQNIFGVSDTYRVGGDEYIALGVNRDEAEISEMIAKLRQAVEAAGYHVAVGMEHHTKDELAVNALVKAAEAKMYLDKDEYYRSSGIDHHRKH